MSLAQSPWAKCGNNRKNTNSSQYPTYTNGSTKWYYDTGLTSETYLNGICIGPQDELYTIDGEVGLRSLTSNGATRWVNSEPLVTASVNRTPAIAQDGSIYVTYSDDPQLFKYDNNGTLEWKCLISESGDSSGSPTILEDGGIVVVGGEDTVVCFEPNGTERWRYISGNAISGTPAISDDGTIYVSKCGLVALNPETGRPIWVFDRAIEAGAVYASPVIGSDGTIYFVSDNGKLYAVGPNGAAKWSSPMIMKTPSGDNGCSHDLVIDNNDILYFFDYGGTMNAINPETRQFVWSRKYTIDNITTIFKGTPIADSRNNLFFGSSVGTIFCIDRQNGSIIWQFQLPERVSAEYSTAAIGSDGTLYIPCGYRGRIHAFESFPPIPKTTVQGYVYDAKCSDDSDENQPPFANAQILTLNKFAYTDETGFYCIEFLMETFPNPVTVVCRSTDNNYIRETRTITLNPGDTVNQNFYLWPSRMYT